MNVEDALGSSLVRAARGFDKDGKCVVSVASYGGGLVWMTGWGGVWSNKWEAVPDGDRSKLDGLDFLPTGPRPAEDFDREIVEIYTAELEAEEVEGSDGADGE